MITQDDVIELYDAAMAKFPVAEEQLLFAKLSGDHAVLMPTIVQRLHWMLTEAYNRGLETGLRP